MLPSSTVTLGLLVEADRYRPDNSNADENAGQYRQVMRQPNLADSLALRVGELFIRLGQNMKKVSLEHLRLAEDPA
jgi:hypothetical protein